MQPVFGKSKVTKELLGLIKRIAPSDVSVLIVGESGSGKEVLARKIHDLSDRSDKAFVAVNCGAIPRDLLESELFGHKKGAFTGAIAERVGKIIAADGGTLFLDEIGDMPMDMQIKLLRVLQERVVDPVGSNVSISVDVRLISATHRDIEKEIEAGSFRADLYYRLNVLPLTLAPLRERAEEIPLLANHFSDVYRQGRKSIKFSAHFLAEMMKYHWPGNIRELSNMIHRLSVLHPGEVISLERVNPTMLPSGLQEAAEAIRAPGYESTIDDEDSSEFEDIILMARGIHKVAEEDLSLKEVVNQVEEGLISRALEEVNGNVSMCARILKIQRTTLIERIKKYGLG
ncbi:sigma-54-dependent Fis family transcriptional regulator [Candidatus Poribacteria bacterium]|jgi:sigma-54 specific flagellar transcriptional regulator A|nr:sigma-54-dependent Fis family transcriptional regulator [Candidatus Poribacteria bacterium]|tara:strand:+ start:2057 stop:3088 length:1032 start_codon:yes stop_codon:yes gene_type:complete